MRGDSNRFASPITETEKRANAETSESSGVGALGGFKPPVEVTLRPGGVHVGVDVALVSFLVNDKAIRARSDERSVLFRFHRTDFERDAGNFFMHGSHAVAQIIVRHKLRMFTGDEKNIAEALLLERAGFGEQIIRRERHAQDRIVAREAAVFAIVDALVREIERREEANDFAEAFDGERMRAAGKVFE